MTRQLGLIVNKSTCARGACLFTFELLNKLYVPLSSGKNTSDVNEAWLYTTLVRVCKHNIKSFKS